MKENQANFPVSRMCRVLGVSPSGYYDWLKREPSARVIANEVLAEKIVSIHAASRGTYGVPRITAELREGGDRVGRGRVRRLMKARGVQGVSRRRWRKTTVRDEADIAAPDLVERAFEANGPDELWVADITYVPTWAGFLFLAVVIDAWSRRVVGWSMANHLRTELVLNALNMAAEQRIPKGVIHHSDQGCQYTSTAFGKRCASLGVRPSTGSVGDCYDNAMAESFFASLECELLDRTSLPNQAAARMAVFDYIEGFYNSKRRHSALGHVAPNEYERRHRAA